MSLAPPTPPDSGSSGPCTPPKADIEQLMDAIPFLSLTPYPHQTQNPTPSIHAGAPPTPPSGGDSEFDLAPSAQQRPTLNRATTPWLGSQGSCVPPSNLPSPRKHPKYSEFKADLESYFLAKWPFSSPKAQKKFLEADFNLWTCYAFPFGDDVRVKLACELLTLDFLVDDHIDTLSLPEATILINRLEAIMLGDLPEPTSPIESMHHTLWKELLSLDPVLGAAVVTSHTSLLRAQVSSTRGTHTTLSSYLDFREVDGGMKATCALHYFVSNTPMSSCDLEILAPLERLASNHICVLNDIVSYDKEARAAEAGHTGAVIVNCVGIAAREMGLGVSGSKNMLWTAVRGYERVFHEKREALLKDRNLGDGARKVVLEIEDRMSGNERWTFGTRRYVV